MATDTGIFLRIDPPRPNWQINILRALLINGWTMNDHGKIVLLPLGDIDDYAWISLPLDEAAQAWKTLEAKLAAQEPLGLMLTWADTQIGGSLLMGDSLVTFSASINRRRLHDLSATDVSWYLERLLPAFRDAKVSVASWEWSEAT
jgi:hypothetical protein